MHIGVDKTLTLIPLFGLVVLEGKPRERERKQGKHEYRMARTHREMMSASNNVGGIINADKFRDYSISR